MSSRSFSRRSSPSASSNAVTVSSSWRRIRSFSYESDRRNASRSCRSSSVALGSSSAFSRTSSVFAPFFAGAAVCFFAAPDAAAAFVASFDASPPVAPAVDACAPLSSLMRFCRSSSVTTSRSSGSSSGLSVGSNVIAVSPSRAAISRSLTLSRTTSEQMRLFTSRSAIRRVLNSFLIECTDSSRSTICLRFFSAFTRCPSGTT